MELTIVLFARFSEVCPSKLLRQQYGEYCWGDTTVEPFTPGQCVRSLVDPEEIARALTAHYEEAIAAFGGETAEVQALTSKTLDEVKVVAASLRDLPANVLVDLES